MKPTWLYSWWLALYTQFISESSIEKEQSFFVNRPLLGNCYLEAELLCGRGVCMESDTVFITSIALRNEIVCSAGSQKLPPDFMRHMN